MTDTPMTPDVAAVQQAATRAIHALKSPTPDGSRHYQSGWDDGLEAAIDAARDALEGPARTLLAEVNRLRALVAELEAQPSRSEVLNKAADRLDAKVDELRAEPRWREGNGDTRGPGLLSSVTELRRMATEDPHDSPLRHAYAVGRDLPEVKPEPPAVKCRCGEPDADPYACEADDCTAEFSELNPFGSGARPVHVASAEVSRKCGTCGWTTSVWHVDDGSAEEELYRHSVREHGGTP